MLNLENFVKERDEMLMKGSIDELRKFVDEHGALYEPSFVESFLNCSDEVAEITLHKMITAATKLPFEYRMNSVAWLTERGYGLYA